MPQGPTQQGGRLLEGLPPGGVFSLGVCFCCFGCASDTLASLQKCHHQFCIHDYSNRAGDADANLITSISRFHLFAGAHEALFPFPLCPESIPLLARLFYGLSLDGGL